jgi:hypothetical protein
MVGRHAWARDRVERMQLAEENFDDTLPWGTYPPNHCDLARVVDLTFFPTNGRVRLLNYVQIVNPTDHHDKLALM